MIDAIICNKCNRIMDLVMQPAASGGTSGWNSTQINDYCCGECKQVITIKEKAAL